MERVRAAHHWAILPSGSAAAVGGHVARLAATGARGLVVPQLTELVHRMVTADEQAGIGRFEGEFWHVDLTGVRLPRPVRPSIPIYLAPLRATMTEMAAEVADGIFGHPVWSPSWITGEVRASVERGLANAGRDAGALLSVRIVVARATRIRTKTRGGRQPGGRQAATRRSASGR
jgi:alkanesulfonate monooxygenase SsuD/methylene tetrahydromethanopterin reductase-like flavin-dependent oxidoreductase (luciferase family)